MAKALVTGNNPVAQARKRPPIKYSDAVAAKIIEAVSDGRTFTDIAKEPWSPNRRTLFRFMDAHPDFREAVETARRQAADKLFAELLEIKTKLASLEIDYKDCKSLVAAAEILKWSLARIDAARWGQTVPTTQPMAICINTTLDLGQGGTTVDGSSNLYRLSVPAVTDVEAVDA